MLKEAGKIIRENFAAKPGEVCAILIDDRAKYKGLYEVVEAFAESARRIGLRCHVIEYPSTGGHGKEPPEEVWVKVFGDSFVKSLKEDRIWEKIVKKEEVSLKQLERYVKDVPDIVIALAYYSTSHTTFRKLLSISGTRYASMPLFEKDMIFTSASVSPKELSPLTSKVAQLLTLGDRVRIKAEGTELEMSIRGREGLADTGDLTYPGAFSNLPAGEAFIAPVEGSAEGVITIEWAPTRRLKEPVVVVIRDGKAVEVKGEDSYAEFLRDTFEKVENSNNVAELGIGTNPKASKPDNILEAEKILGTVHVAFGDNHSFGGMTKSNFHQDHVIFCPAVEIEVNGRWLSIMQDGKLTI